MPLLANTQKTLLAQCMPFLHFAPTERFFPSDVDAWITSAFTEKWTAPLSRKGGNVVLASLSTDTFPTGFPAATNILAGSHPPGGTRLQPTDLAALVANSLARMSDRQDVFMDFAGWPPQAGGTAAPDFTKGSPERIYPGFSTLANAMNPPNLVEADNLQAPSTAGRPHTPQGVAPVIYADVDWAGRFSRMSDQLEARQPGSGDFGPSNPLRDGLDRLLVFTYYFFYPLTDSPPGPAAATGISAVQREGQWEAVSLYFRLTPDFGRTSPGQGVPGEPQINVPDFQDPGTGSAPRLLFLVYSATTRSDDTNPPAEVRFADDKDVSYPNRTDGTGLPIAPATLLAPAVYITSGIHKNMFGPVATKTTEDAGPNSNLNTAAGVVGAAAGGVAGIPVAGWIIAIILALIAIILLILAAVLRDSKTTYTPTGPDDDFVPPGGPSTGPAQSPGAVPTASRPTLETFSEMPAASGEGNDPLYQLPPWWQFPGRWGIRVEPSSDSRWDNGMRFRDAQGRTRSYWNTLALFAFISQDANAMKALGRINSAA